MHFPTTTAGLDPGFGLRRGIERQVNAYLRCTGVHPAQMAIEPVEEQEGAGHASTKRTRGASRRPRRGAR